VQELLQNPVVELVRVLDNFATGALRNIEDLTGNAKFELVEGDIRDYSNCVEACMGIDLVSHQAALGSVPRSINDPVTTNEVNITGTLNVFTAAKEQRIRRVVYAASSSTYGDHPGLPKREDDIGKPLSPYAVTKYVNELYADVYARTYNMELVGLRYFNVFGPRQNPAGPYAAVIPIFIKAVLDNVPPVINGDGTHSRDFTFIDNVVQANVCALFNDVPAAVNQVYNIAYGQQTSLIDLFQMIKEIAGSDLVPVFGPERQGDVKNSLADISKAKNLLGYSPAVSIRDGLKATFEWYRKQHHFSYST
ncbi:MAG TPA: SDR family oxidoreductase, partial [Chitinophagaceae bacterium]|nr:SDR family oxidoreductase [Chitinophagaceae bacterium]